MIRAADFAQPPRGLSEADLTAAHGRREQARPCVCGTVVIADPFDPTEGVRCHQAEPRHVAWREWRTI